VIAAYDAFLGEDHIAEFMAKVPDDLYVAHAAEVIDRSPMVLVSAQKVIAYYIL